VKDDRRHQGGDRNRGSAKPARLNPLLREARLRKGLTQADLAEKLNDELPMSVGRKHIGNDLYRWENVNVPHVKVQHLLAFVLGVSREELGFVPANTETHAVAMSSAVREERLTWVTPIVARTLQDVTSALRRAFEFSPADLFLGVIRPHTAQVVAALEALGREPELLSLLGQSQELEARACCDAVNYPAAMDALGRARASGRASGLPALAAYLIGSQASVESECGRAENARRLLESGACAEISARSPAGTRSWLALLKAEALALTEPSSKEALRVVEQAERLLEQAAPTDEQPWMEFYGDPWLRAYRGRCALQHGAEGAEADLRYAAKRLDPGYRRHTARILTDLARLLTVEGRVDEASACLDEAYELALETGSALRKRGILEARRLLE
jgi:transcriptional regulator with XRE-family HTH domain